MLPSPAWLNAFRPPFKYEGTTEANCQSVINPLVDVAKYNGYPASSNNRANYVDKTLEKWFAEMNRTGDVAEQRAIMRKFETRVVGEQPHTGLTLWWRKINPHRSYVKGWNIAPSHYLNQHLDQVWLDKS